MKTNQTLHETTAVQPLDTRLSGGRAYCVVALACLGLGTTLPAKAGIIANSSSEFVDVQGQGGWSYGYRDLPAEGASENYDPDRDFIPFAGGVGKGDWNGTTQHWTGSGWKAADGSELTGNSSRVGASTRWTIRRWQAAELTEKGPVSLRMTLSKSDITCGNGVTTALFINGQLATKISIAFDRSTSLTRTFYALLTPGDRVDLALQSLGTDGTTDAQCDSTFMSLIVNTTIAPEPKQPDGKLFLTSLPTPKLQILSQTHSSANRRTTLNWRSQASATYGIEVSDDMLKWTRIKSDLPGGATTVSWSEQVADAVLPSRFYRVVQESKSIEGLWMGLYDNTWYELIRIKLDGDQAVATKVIGDNYVPAGKITWEASVSSGDGQMQYVSGVGFANPFWLAARLRIVNPDRISLSIPSENLVMSLRRVD